MKHNIIIFVLLVANSVVFAMLGSKIADSVADSNSFRRSCTKAGGVLAQSENDSEYKCYRPLEEIK